MSCAAKSHIYQHKVTGRQYQVRPFRPAFPRRQKEQNAQRTPVTSKHAKSSESSFNALSASIPKATPKVGRGKA